MEMATETLPEGIEKIALAGRMDSAGAQAIDVRFTALTTRPALIVVDMQQVSFLASIGIRTLVSSAKALSRCGGRMAIAGAQPLVHDVLTLAGIDALIPMFADVTSACAGLKASAGSV